MRGRGIDRDSIVDRHFAGVFEIQFQIDQQFW